MAKKGKKYNEAVKKYDKEKRYSLLEGLKLVQDLSYANFDETVEVAVKLGVDPRHADQMVRGTVVLPNGVGKEVRVLVFAEGDKAEEAEQAGADYVGSTELVDKIKGGWLDFDTAIATPPMMAKIKTLGRVLGPRGLMPNPKTGTLTMNIANAVREAKAGKIEFRVDKTANLHVPVGKVSFPTDKLAENTGAFLMAVLRAKPASAKGQYMRSITLSSTMGPGVKLDVQNVINELKR